MCVIVWVLYEWRRSHAYFMSLHGWSVILAATCSLCVSFPSANCGLVTTFFHIYSDIFVNAQRFRASHPGWTGLEVPCVPGLHRLSWPLCRGCPVVAHGPWQIGPAQASGLICVGDVLVAVGDDRVKGMRFPEVLSEHKTWERVPIEL